MEDCSFHVFLSGCSALCGSCPASGSKASLGNSLMHSVMKLASGVAPDNSSIQKLAFFLLANLSLSRDCRGSLQKVSTTDSPLKPPFACFLLWKRHIVMICLHDSQSFMHFPRFQNNFLQAFPSVLAPKSGGSKAALAAGGGGGSLLGLWLKLLVNLSFAEDGQQSILRVSGVLELLADLAQHRRPALLILHNLCFCPANKPHIIANGTGGVGRLIRCLYFCCSYKKHMQYISLLCSIRCICWEISARKQISRETDVLMFFCVWKEGKKNGYSCSSCAHSEWGLAE